MVLKQVNQTSIKRFSNKQLNIECTDNFKEELKNKIFYKLGTINFLKMLILMTHRQSSTIWQGSIQENWTLY